MLNCPNPPSVFILNHNWTITLSSALNLFVFDDILVPTASIPMCGLRVTPLP
jgi:hypothetical protein